MTSLSNQIKSVKSVLDSIEAKQIDSVTKSRYVTNGYFAMYVILLPAPNKSARKAFDFLNLCCTKREAVSINSALRKAGFPQRVKSQS